MPVTTALILAEWTHFVAQAVNQPCISIIFIINRGNSFLNKCTKEEVLLMDYKTRNGLNIPCTTPTVCFLYIDVKNYTYIKVALKKKS